MTEFEIGDDEYTEEVNTSYDQNQPIGDEPQALNTELSNSEPIDARTGRDFLTINNGSEGWRDTLDDIISGDWIYTDEEKEFLYGKEFKTVWQQLGYESLNQDGTGVRVATRGINVKKTPLKVIRFVYVSKGDCPICKQYDGHSWEINSPNRPIIPRFEGKHGDRPFTHPHCKCKWVGVFSDAESKSDEVNQADFDRTRKWYGAGFDKLTRIEQKMAMIDMLKQSLGMETEAEEDIIDPIPIASMTQIAFNHLKPLIKHKLDLGEAFVEQEHPRKIDGKFTSKGGQEDPYTAKNLANAYPNLKPEFINRQLGKADVIRAKAIGANQKIKNNLKQRHKDINIGGRIKSAGSMVGKLGRKPDLYNDVDDLNDVSGVRVIAKNLNSVREVVDGLKDDYEIINEKNNIDKSQGGYRSYHVIVKDKTSGFVSEIQIRTKNQDSWAKWSWKNTYKPQTKKLRAFINSNKEAITNYSLGMSNYFYEQDQGLNPNIPKCPSDIAKILGCLA